MSECTFCRAADNLHHEGVRQQLLELRSRQGLLAGAHCPARLQVRRHSCGPDAGQGFAARLSRGQLGNHGQQLPQELALGPCLPVASHVSKHEHAWSHYFEEAPFITYAEETP